MVAEDFLVVELSCILGCVKGQNKLLIAVLVEMKLLVYERKMNSFCTGFGRSNYFRFKLGHTEGQHCNRGAITTDDGTHSHGLCTYSKRSSLRKVANIRSSSFVKENYICF